MVPQVLASFLAIKREEVNHALKNPLSAKNVKKGRSPQKGSKGHKLLLAKDKELAAERKLKRFNIIDLIDKLYTCMEGVRHQDNLVEQVKGASRRYKETHDSTSEGLKHLLGKWDIEVDSFRDRQALVAADAEDANGIVAIV